MRIEDIDGTRSRAEHVETILDDLTWLGLEWDGPPVFQSARLGVYQAALDDLRGRGLLYPCFCTRADIAASVTAPHGPDGALYPGTCRGLITPDLSRPHCWRLDMAAASRLAGPLTFADSRFGTIAADPQAHGDVVLARKDAPASYHLAVTLDDAAQGVSDVVRGEDLLPATHVHRLLQALFDLPVPRYHHHPLLAGADGVRLAKRHGAPSLADMRAGGADGRALADALRRGEVPVGFGAAKG